jgi:hypothetical protein
VKAWSPQNLTEYQKLEKEIEMKKHILISILSLLVMGLPTLALAQDDAQGAAASAHGMSLVEKDSRGAIYADPDVDWSVYSKIILDDATVAFRKNWRRDQNRSRTQRVNTSDMERIKVGLAEMFDEVFIDELVGNNDFEIVEDAGDDVLRITPHIVDLDVYAPDVRTSTNVRNYTEAAGRMTLKLELYDSVTGDLIALASVQQETRDRGYAQWANSVTNKADARDMLQRWAKGLSKRLNEATGKM